MRDFLKERRCNFCMYRDGCFVELSGDDGRCIAFCVALEDAEAYEKFLADKAAREQYEREHYFDGLDD